MCHISAIKTHQCHEHHINTQKDLHLRPTICHEHSPPNAGGLVASNKLDIFGNEVSFFGNWGPLERPFRGSYGQNFCVNYQHIYQSHLLTMSMMANFHGRTLL